MLYLAETIHILGYDLFAHWCFILCAKYIYFVTYKQPLYSSVVISTISVTMGFPKNTRR